MEATLPTEGGCPATHPTMQWIVEATLQKGVSSAASQRRLRALGLCPFGPLTLTRLRLRLDRGAMESTKGRNVRTRATRRKARGPQTKCGRCGRVNRCRSGVQSIATGGTTSSGRRFMKRRSRRMRSSSRPSPGSPRSRRKSRKGGKPIQIGPRSGQRQNGKNGKRKKS